MFIKNNLSWINIDIACECLELTRSNYYEWLKNADQRQKRNIAKQERLKNIMTEFINSKNRYGSVKITEILKKKNITISKNSVAKLMHDNGLRSIVNKKFKATTNSNHKLEVFENILDREFIVDKPNYAWVGDITYIPTNEGCLYLATVIDLYSNKLIGYAMSDRY